MRLVLPYIPYRINRGHIELKKSTGCQGELVIEQLERQMVYNVVKVIFINYIRQLVHMNASLLCFQFSFPAHQYNGDALC